MGVGFSKRRGVANVSIVTNTINNVTGIDLDTVDKYLTQEAAQNAGLGIDDYFFYDVGSIEGNAGTLVKILEIV